MPAGCMMMDGCGQKKGRKLRIGWLVWGMTPAVGAWLEAFGWAVGCVERETYEE